MAAVEEKFSVASFAFWSAILAFVGSLVHTVFYNLYRHPLAAIPGPKLAGATYLYQSYFSLVGGSRYYCQIGKLHQKYGKLEPSLFPKWLQRSSFLRPGCAHHPR